MDVQIVLTGKQIWQVRNSLRKKKKNGRKSKNRHRFYIVTYQLHKFPDFMLLSFPWLSCLFFSEYFEHDQNNVVLIK